MLSISSTNAPSLQSTSPSLPPHQSQPQTLPHKAWGVQGKYFTTPCWPRGTRGCGGRSWRWSWWARWGPGEWHWELRGCICDSRGSWGSGKIAWIGVGRLLKVGGCLVWLGWGIRLWWVGWIKKGPGGAHLTIESTGLAIPLWKCLKVRKAGFIIDFARNKNTSFGKVSDLCAESPIGDFQYY